MANFPGSASLTQALSPPRSVEQITSAAQDYEYNAQVPLRYWLRTAAALPQQAEIYMSEGDEETTYLLLFRHAHLVLAQLTAHPDAKDPNLSTQISQAKREVVKNLKKLDALKPRIKQRYERYTQLMQEREARKVVVTSPDADSVESREAKTESRYGNFQQLNGYENSDLAVRLAQREFSRRADARQVPATFNRQPRDDKEDLSQRLQAIRSRIEPSHTPANTGSQTRNDSDFGQHADYSYPAVRARDTRLSSQLSEKYQSEERQNNTQRSPLPPVVPPKPVGSYQAIAPPRPEKFHENSSTRKTSTDTKYTFASTASLENGAPLRTLFLPPTLRTTFLRLAHKNTLANLETCAFLAGTLISNALFVSHLIVPEQKATSDTCEMINESQLFDYVDTNDLMVLGWIHTHPSQTCFMSSRDLHTHAGYQMMLAESIAIVCAPSKGNTTHGGDWGAYRLTDPPGKMAILNCTKPGLFHPHEVDNVYTDALRPGHVVEAKDLKFEVVDLRS